MKGHTFPVSWVLGDSDRLDQHVVVTDGWNRVVLDRHLMVLELTISRSAQIASVKCSCLDFTSVRTTAFIVAGMFDEVIFASVDRDVRRIIDCL